MKTLSHRRTIIVLLLAAMATSSFASLASADRGRRYKGYRQVVREVHHHPRVSYSVRGSDSGALIGFVGGLILGAAIANAAPVYTYWDADCHRSFVSLEAYHRHGRIHHHHQAVRVIEVPEDYGWDDYHVCDYCDHSYWGSDHACD